MSLLIKDVSLDDKSVDIYIEGSYIKSISLNLDTEAEKVVNGKNKVVIPGFVNGHGHAAMTLFRGWGDDMSLESWLKEKIWPYEAKLTEEDVYWGARLACLEMIKSGTTCFNDMYWFYHSTAKAVEEMGMRAVLSSAVFDNFDGKKAKEARQEIEDMFEKSCRYSDRINFALGPHSIYTVSTETLKWIEQFAGENNLLIHTHIAETQVEHSNSIKNFGLSPVKYLNKLGLLSPKLLLAHCLWVDDEEIYMLGNNAVNIVHNPNSNLKLASGYTFKYNELVDAGANICIGTDGCSSSNNLDMLEAAKIASLLQKGWRYDPVAMTAKDTFKCITENGAKALNIKAGKIQEGYLADIVLIDTSLPVFTPKFNFVSDLIYAANGSCVDTVICDGKVIMENKYVQDEEEIISKVNSIAQKLFK